MIVAAALIAPTATAVSPAHAALPDRSCGTVTGADSTTASGLNRVLTGKLANAMTSYRVSCARAIVDAVRARSLPDRAAVIAVTTAIVESELRNNPNVLDHTSVGLFQQQTWWGSYEQRLDPVYATNKFLDAMLSSYPNGSWQQQPIGVVCQKVQVSAFPEAYQPQAADAQRIVDALAVSTPNPQPQGPTGRPNTVVDPATGHLITYVRDSNNHLWSVDPQGPGWIDFGAYAAGDPVTVVNPANNHLVTYVNGPDNRLWSVDPQGPGWIKFDATLSGTVMAPNAVPNTVVDPATGHL
ncbi:hypothetical protein ACFV1O_01945, partial [Kitasatospora purpeofusca]